MTTFEWYTPQLLLQRTWIFILQIISYELFMGVTVAINCLVCLCLPLPSTTSIRGLIYTSSVQHIICCVTETSPNYFPVA